MNFRAIFLSCFVAFGFLTSSSIGHASDDHVSVESKIEKAFFTIGDRVQYELTIRHPANIHVLNIDTTETLQDFEIKEEKSFHEEDAGTITEGKRASITSFQLGEYVLPPAKISCETAKGEKKEIVSNKLFVSVESIDKKGQPEQDIKGPKGVVGFVSRLWRWFSAVILLAGVVTIGVWLWRRNHQNHLAMEQIPSLSPSEEAYRALSELFDSDYLKRGQYKAYFSRMSDIIRRYLERHLRFLALESTTGEVLKTLASLSVDASIQELAQIVLESCDFVKFAKYRPAPDEIFKLNRQCKEIVDRFEATQTMGDSSSSNDSLQKP